MKVSLQKTRETLMSLMTIKSVLLSAAALLMSACATADSDAPPPVRDSAAGSPPAVVTSRLSPEVVQVVPDEQEAVPIRSSGSPVEVAAQPLPGPSRDAGGVLSRGRAVVLLTLAGGLLMVAVYLSVLGRRKQAD